MSLENELVESSVVLANYREKCAEFEQIIKDYDDLCLRLIPYTYQMDAQGMELRKRAREEGIEL